MYCPFKMANSELAPHYIPEAGYYSERDWMCEKELCEHWNDSMGKCSLTVQAFLTGLEVERRESSIGKGERD